MPNSNTSDLIDLVNSLDRSEKRHFKLYSKRLESNKEVLFLRLFDLIESCDNLDQVNRKIKTLKLNNQQLTNLKRNLSEQLLKSLRLIFVNKDPALQIRKNIDFAHILYTKGLFTQAADLLHKLLDKDGIGNYTSLKNEAIEFLKKIESRHITRSRSVENRMETLLSNSEEASIGSTQNQELLNLSLKIQGLYIKTGFAKNERDSMLFKAFFDSNIPIVSDVKTSLGRVYWHQCFAWYYYANLQFDLCYKHSLSWIKEIEKKLDDSDGRELYMRGMHYALTSLFYSDKNEEHTTLFKSYKKLRNEMYARYSRGNKLLDFAYYNNAELNNFIITNKYHRFNLYVQEIDESINSNSLKIDVHRKHIIYYKIAMIYSIQGHYDKALDYINSILTDYKNHLRGDLNPYTKLLSLLCHFKLNNFQYVENQIDSLRIEFNSKEQSNKVVELVLLFLRRSSKAMNFGIDDDIQKTYKKLEVLKKHRYQKVAYIYYDYLNWMKSVLHNTTIEKARNMQ